MRKGVASHDGLVGLNGHIHETRHHAARRINLCGVDVGVNLQRLMALQYHGNLLKRRIARTLADAVDGHLHLTGTCQHTIQRVCRRHTKVVMAVG